VWGFYDSDLTDAQWVFLQPFLSQRKPIGASYVSPPSSQRHSLRGQGRHPMGLAPGGFPPFQNRVSHFRRWALNHTWEAINACLRALARQTEEQTLPVHRRHF
jgi:transposase